jgi:hypothetical protein
MVPAFTVEVEVTFALRVTVESPYVAMAFEAVVFVAAVAETVVVAVDVFGVLSLGDETVATFVSVVAVLGAVTLILMFGVVAPAARFPLRLHVTVPERFVQFQLASVPVKFTKVTPLGSGSVTFTADAASGPVLVALIV